jgi:hypothetical protein
MSINTMTYNDLLGSVPFVESTRDHCIAIDRPAIEDSNELRLLRLYAALREGRMSGKKMLIARFDAGTYELRAAPFQPVRDEPGRWVTDVQHAMIRVFGAMSDETKRWVRENLLVEEVEATVKKKCQAIYGNAFFRAVFDRTLTRNQYIEQLANNHQFVRWTTRLLGRIIGLTADRVLRKSYIHHLEGEIDHELLLENDLAYLGADVEYVRSEMTPNPDIQQFMCIQESMSAFHQDPLLFLAVPFSIEGVTAFLSADFVEALHDCIRTWGYEKPSHATTFLTSHIEFDGADDGHWENSRAMFGRFLTTERDTQRVLNIVHMVLDAFNRGLESYVAVSDPAG